ncbi:MULTISPECIES: energy transducer TonB [Emticicia]|uniref:energy transducer TonB n=1 Tax=Emticicia TaxID=312278 RepID=UPI0007D8C9B8|nr:MULTISPECIES: hypothetical protein [Emticicia]
MKNLYLISLLCISTGVIAQENTLIYTTADIWPTYPQGNKALYTFICTNQNVSVEAIPSEKNKNIVFVRFVVEKDGSLSGHKVMRGINQTCDAEALRITKLLSKWNPGGTIRFNKFQPLRMYMTIAVKFFRNFSDCEASYYQLITK